MLKQSAMSSSENFPVVNGDLVNLGAFLDLKNTMSEKQHLRFSLSLHPSSLDFIEFTPSAQEGNMTVDEGNLLMSVMGEIPYSNNPQNGKITYLAGETTNPSKFIDFSTCIKDNDLFYFDALKSRNNKTRKSLRELSHRVSSGEGPLPDEWFADLTEELVANELGTEFQRELISTTHLPPIRGELSRLVDFSDTTKESAERRRGGHSYPTATDCRCKLWAI